VGYYTLGAFVALTAAKLTGLVGFSWGWVYAPLFIHIGAAVMMVRYHLAARKAMQQLGHMLAQAEEEETNDPR